jgi:dihydrofolate synthase/folylpolyglutamate synthase
LASILQSAGYKTGLYTSPHLKDFRERIKVNGEMIPENVVVDFVNQSKSIIESLQPSFFELTMAMAFEYFAQVGVDVAIVEVGMGGRLDSTNIIQPILSLITNIGLDHTDFLGDTLELIAAEKAGIIKYKTPVVISQTQAETKPVFIEKAKQMEAPIFFADDNFKTISAEPSNSHTQTLRIETAANELLTFETDLLGFCQHQNLPGVLQAVEELNKLGLKLDDAAIHKGILFAARQTGLNGRWQTINQNPLAICDTGHNEDGIRTVLMQLSTCKYERLHIVFGVVNDKSIAKILSMLPKDAIYYFTKANIPRALNENILAEQAKEFGLKGKTFDNVADAYAAALGYASQNDMIFIGGSTFVVAEVV